MIFARKIQLFCARSDASCNFMFEFWGYIFCFNSTLLFYEYFGKEKDRVISQLNFPLFFQFPVSNYVSFDCLVRVFWMTLYFLFIPFQLKPVCLWFFWLDLDVGSQLPIYFTGYAYLEDAAAEWSFLLKAMDTFSIVMVWVTASFTTHNSAPRSLVATCQAVIVILYCCIGKFVFKSPFYWCEPSISLLNSGVINSEIYVFWTHC